MMPAVSDPRWYDQFTVVSFVAVNGAHLLNLTAPRTAELDELVFASFRQWYESMIGAPQNDPLRELRVILR